MLFKDFSTTNDLLVTKIQDIKKGVNCKRMGNKPFYSIRPNQDKEMKLKSTYDGAYSEIQAWRNANQELKERAKKKMLDNNFTGTPYKNDDASLKLHLNLNNIGDIDENVILGLIELLIEESESENNMSFHFKIIDPLILYAEKRFRNTDQLTIYFDKYSSAADMIRLAKKVETYLLEKGIRENTTTLGPKDSFGFNSFVSARFDNNKFLERWDVYPFFDLELKKFFEGHNENDLGDFPLCLFEAVFYKLITSEDIQDLKSESGLSDKDSAIIQNELALACEYPAMYLRALEAAKLQHEKLSENTPEKIGPTASKKQEIPAGQKEVENRNKVLPVPQKAAKLPSEPKMTPIPRWLYSNHAPNYPKNTVKKTNHPSSYTKMWNQGQVIANEFPQEMKDYYSALAILKDYCKTPCYNTPSFISNINLVFTSHWNRHHIDTVRALVLSLTDPSTPQKSADMTVERLLFRLNNDLIKNGTLVKHNGSLAKRIDFIQKQAQATIKINQYNI